MKTAIYPGSFDPITHGHLNLIQRSLKVFDHLLVAVAQNIHKTGVFDLPTRVEMIREAVGDEPRIQVESFDGLLVDYAKARNANIIVRGLRASSDFEVEFPLAHMNRRLSGSLETVFMMTGEEHFYVSSQLVREIARFGGPVDSLVPRGVAARLAAHFAPSDNA